MSVITSSNRSPAEWTAYLERNRRTSVESFMSERPHSPADVTAAIARSAINPPGPFDHVIAVDECGAPIHSDTIGGAITVGRLAEIL